MAGKTGKKENFEESMKELEVVVKTLESGEATLDEMLELFKRGVELTQTCTKLLDSAEQKITVLMQNKDGSMSEQEFEPQA